MKGFTFMFVIGKPAEKWFFVQLSKTILKIVAGPFMIGLITRDLDEVLVYTVKELETLRADKVKLQEQVVALTKEKEI